MVILPHVERFGAGMLLPLCVLLSEWCVRFGAGMVVPLESVGVLLRGAGAGCCLLSEWCVQFGAMLVALRVLLQALPEGDVWRCCCQSGVRALHIFKPCFGAGMLVSGCRWKVLLEGAVELACLCWVMLEGAARRVRTVPNSCCKGASEGCCFKVLQLKWCVCALELACWCHCRMPLQGAVVGFSQKQQEA